MSAAQWIDGACAVLVRDPAVVRVTVVGLRGSVPREAGASMVVDARSAVGSIGGGRLEWQATHAARRLLRTRGTAPVRIANLVLGPDLGQCCGGRVELWLERLTREDLPWLREASRSLLRAREAHRPAPVLITELNDGVASHRLQPSVPGGAGVQLLRSPGGEPTLRESIAVQRPRLWVFGAGHVGQALIRLLSELAVFEITWIDSRPELLPAQPNGCVEIKACANPVELIGAAPAGTTYVVLTHDHALDYALCRSILRRGDSCWLGLIGSASKAARFRSRLLRDGVGRDALSGLSCPIGVPGIASKLPASIAISIAAQLLQLASPAAPVGARRQPEECGPACTACGPGPERPATT